MLPLRWMVEDVHLLVGPVLGDQVVKKLLVDVVVEVLDGHLNLGRLSDVIFVDLKITRCGPNRLAADIGGEDILNLGFVPN